MYPSTASAMLVPDRRRARAQGKSQQARMVWLARIARGFRLRRAAAPPPVQERPLAAT